MDWSCRRFRTVRAALRRPKKSQMRPTRSLHHCSHRLSALFRFTHHSGGAALSWVYDAALSWETVKADTQTLLLTVRPQRVLYAPGSSAATPHTRALLHSLTRDPSRFMSSLNAPRGETAAAAILTPWLYLACSSQTRKEK